MKIQFKEVRYKNLLSSGNAWTVIPLNDNRTTLISGTNGSGKSTLIDLITGLLNINNGSIEIIRPKKGLPKYFWV